MKLAQFAEWVISEGLFDGCELSGDEIQDKALECGLLKKKLYDPELHSDVVSDWQEFEAGDDFYMLSDELKAALPEEKL